MHYLALTSLHGHTMSLAQLRRAAVTEGFQIDLSHNSWLHDVAGPVGTHAVPFC